MREKCVNKTTISSIITKSHTPSPPFLQTSTRRYTNPVFFNLVTPSWITTSDISTSTKIRFHIVWWSLITSSLHTKLRLQIPCTSNSPSHHIYNAYNRVCIWNPAKHIWRGLFWKYIYLLRPLSILTEELHRICLTAF